MPVANDVPLSPLSFLTRSADVHPDATGVVGADGQAISWAAFHRMSARMADAVRGHGVEEGQRVAILARNTEHLLAAHYAVPGAGAALVALNIRLAPEEYLGILRHSGARLLLLDPAFEAQVAPIRDRLPVDLVVGLPSLADDDPDDVGPGGSAEPLPTVGYEEWVAAAPEGPGMVGPADERAPISVNYTSGTTGRPKGALYTHRGAYLNALGLCVQVGLRPDSAYLWTLPMFHCNGWCFTWAVTAVAGTHVCLPRFDAGRAMELAAHHRVTHLCGAPVVLADLAAAAEANPVDLSHGVTAAVGGAPPTPRVIETMRGVGVEVTHLYGLTETYGPATICEPQPSWEALDPAARARAVARQGVRTVNVEGVRVVDEDMADVPDDGQTMGEIVVRANTVTAGYLDDEEATAQAFRGGWFHTGDLAVMHPDGYVEIRDRAKDIIISGGENISSIEVENVIAAHPAVAEVAVVGTPHERWGEVPVAVVTLRPGEEATEAELIGWVKERLARYKAPHAVRFATLPKTSTGKVQKFVLRQQVEEASG